MKNPLLILKSDIHSQQRIQPHFWLMLSIVLQALFLTAAHSQVHKYRFTHLTLDEGLSAFRTYDVLQDATGYIWISTVDGLNRYDGNTIRVFRYNEENTGSIAWNVTGKLFLDSRNSLWIGSRTYAGLDRFDPVTQTFAHHRHNPLRQSSLPPHDVRAIVELPSEEGKRLVFLIGTSGGGLSIFYPDADSAVHLRHVRGDAGTLCNDTVNALAFESPKRVWIGTANGLDAFDTESRTFSHYKHSPTISNSLTSNIINALFFERGILWIGADREIDKLDVRKGNFTRIRNSKGSSATTSNSITEFLRQAERFLWVATADGVARLDTQADVWTEFRHDPNDPSSLLHDLVRSMCADRSGNIWLATDRGISRFSPRSEAFHHYALTNDPSSDQSVSAILANSDNDIWLAANNGVKRFDPHRGEFIFSKELEGLGEAAVLYKDPRGGLWAATYPSGSLARVDPTNNHVAKLGLVAGATSLLLDNIGTMWVGTYSEGLLFVDPARMTLRTLPDLPPQLATVRHPIFSIVQTRDATIWIAVDGEGLYSWNRRTQKFTHLIATPNEPDSLRLTLRNNRITALYEDRVGFLWIAAERYVHRFDPVTDQIKDYDATAEGKTPQFMSIMEDDRGRIWLSTLQSGLFCLDPKTGRFKNYTTRDGLQNDIFYYAAAKCSNGDLVFGGEKGFNIFSPDSIYDNPFPPAVVLTELRILSDPVRALYDAGLQHSLVLRHDENYFSIEFAALEFTNPEKNRFQYRLEPVDTIWREARNERMVTYAKIPNNEEYVFKVRASNSDGVWNEQGVSLPISIGPPFYKEWWFRILVALAVIAALTLGYNYRVRQLLAVERLRLRIAGDLHDDIGSSLSGIALMTDIVRSHIPKESKDHQFLTTANFAARQTTDALRDIVWLINPEHDKPEDMILRMKSAASVLLSQTSYTFEHTSKELPALDMEFRRNLILVYKEILNNIAKHAKASNVKIVVETDNKTFTLSVQDDGVGFDTDEAAKRDGHGLSSLQRRTEKLNGEIAIISKPGSGTTTTLRAGIHSTNGSRTLRSLFNKEKHTNT